jgi:ABC-2 type transport system ATP-binding protein
LTDAAETLTPSAPAPAGPPVLEIRGLTKSYGRTEVLKGLSLAVREGEVYGFLGRNGAGKSTTIRIVMGITGADGGQVSLFGQPSRADAIPLRQKIGYVAQEQHFYGWMTPTQLGKFVGAFFPTWDGREFERLLDQLALPAHRKVRTFSGGMKVKTGLALALAHRPPLLVLDEPMAGLDPVARREFLEMVRADAERTGRTTFFSTHLIDEIELAAHRVGIVDGGKTLYEGTIADLAARSRLLRHPPEADGGDPELPAAVFDPEGGLTVVSRRERDGLVILMVQADDPARFEALEPGGWELARPTLEDVFVEMVRQPLTRAE